MRNPILGAVFLSALAGCAFHPCDGPSTELAATLRSRSSAGAVRSALPACEWTVLEQSQSDTSRGVPPLNILVVSAGKCSVVPESTRVELVFLNDRLMQVIAVLPDPAAYLETLSHQAG